jgi:transcriptional regulator
VTARYRFTFFFQPVDNLPAVNVISAGQAFRSALCTRRSELERRRAGLSARVRTLTLGLTSDPSRMDNSGQMSTRDERLALMQGTLDVLILRTLIFGPQHGQGIARTIQETSGNELLVEHGALYPALQRLEAQGWIAAKWGTSTTNRRARFYTLTRAGRAQLGREASRWNRLVAAMSRVLGPEPGKG